LWKVFIFLFNQNGNILNLKLDLFLNFLNIFLTTKYNLDGKIYEKNILNISLNKSFLKQKYISLFNLKQKIWQNEN
jgi:hypothetical protein